eukprot:7383792-Prymnesium_polylepis.1
MPDCGRGGMSAGTPRPQSCAAWARAARGERPTGCGLFGGAGSLSRLLRSRASIVCSPLIFLAATAPCSFSKSCPARQVHRASCRGPAMQGRRQAVGGRRVRSRAARAAGVRRATRCIARHTRAR